MFFISHMRQCEVSDHNLPGALDLQPYGFLLQLHTATVYKRKLALEEKILQYQFMTFIAS